MKLYAFSEIMFLLPAPSEILFQEQPNRVTPVFIQDGV